MVGLDRSTKELPPCYLCGAAAVVCHLYDTYDRADYGWVCGCPRWSLLDKVHPKDRERPEVRALTKEAAEAAWIKKCEEVNDGT